ncbi:hypothetical protein J6590_008637 [Homalodisca vitripennis]|nr:hypothetical protein J6590_008637 [Homalodisca vitripennis]
MYDQPRVLAMKRTTGSFTTKLNKPPEKAMLTRRARSWGGAHRDQTACEGRTGMIQLKDKSSCRGFPLGDSIVGLDRT